MTSFVPLSILARFMGAVNLDSRGHRDIYGGWMLTVPPQAVVVPSWFAMFRAQL
jgi:hypothetical protein